jgi:hypothetical protein
VFNLKAVRIFAWTKYRLMQSAAWLLAKPLQQATNRVCPSWHAIRFSGGIATQGDALQVAMADLDCA